MLIENTFYSDEFKGCFFLEGSIIIVQEIVQVKVVTISHNYKR